MKNTGLSASSKKIILFLVLAQFFCFKNFSLDFSSNDENPYMEKKNTEKGLRQDALCLYCTGHRRKDDFFP